MAGVCASVIELAEPGPVQELYATVSEYDVVTVSVASLLGRVTAVRRAARTQNATSPA